jgi:hypothetical protein
MKRLLVLALVALGFSIVAAQTASSSDSQGPPCSNITNALRVYNTQGVDVTVSLQAPACSFVTYSFVVLDPSTGNKLGFSNTPDMTDSTNPACTPDVAGDGCLHFNIPISNGPNVVCIYAETSIKSHVADHAPDISDFPCPGSPDAPIAVGPASRAVTKTGSGADGSFG